jgi:hypothetical protein
MKEQKCLFDGSRAMLDEMGLLAWPRHFAIPSLKWEIVNDLSTKEL